MALTTATQDVGLRTLEADQLGLLRELDRLFLSWAEEVSAPERRYPFLLDVRDLETIDYYDNFPHLGLTVSALHPEGVASSLQSADRPLVQLPAEVLKDSRFALPSAGCYSVYLDLQDTRVPDEGFLVTTAATCFRNEDHYDGLRRLLGFTMREIVYVGDGPGAQEHIERFAPKVLQLGSDLGLDMRTEVATDPFFDPNGSRAKMQALFPVKREFIVDGLAIGSVNYHRNFFGERCRVRHGDEVAHTSCVGLGLERWVAVLTDRFGDTATARRAVTELR